MIIDMGMHILHRTPGSHLLVQAVTPGLEARARSRPQPTSGVLQPGGQAYITVWYSNCRMMICCKPGHMAHIRV